MLASLRPGPRALQRLLARLAATPPGLDGVAGEQRAKRNQARHRGRGQQQDGPTVAPGRRGPRWDADLEVAGLAQLCAHLVAARRVGAGQL